MELPIEVYEAVIDQTSDDNASLRDLSLTCAKFLPRSRCHLFRRIRIRTVEQMESSRGFLDAHSWLLPLVHKVTLFSKAPSRDYDSKHARNARVLDVVPVHLLTRFPNLRVWAMEMYDSLDGPSLSLHRSALSLYSRHSSLIQRLDLCHITFYRFSDFTGLVSAFTSIHTLTCGWIRFWQEVEEEPTDHSLYVRGTGTLSQSLQISTLQVSFRSPLSINDMGG